MFPSDIFSRSHGQRYFPVPSVLYFKTSTQRLYLGVFETSSSLVAVGEVFSQSGLEGASMRPVRLPSDRVALHQATWSRLVRYLIRAEVVRQRNLYQRHAVASIPLFGRAGFPVQFTEKGRCREIRRSNVRCVKHGEKPEIRPGRKKRP